MNWIKPCGPLGNYDFIHDPHPSGNGRVEGSVFPGGNIRISIPEVPVFSVGRYDGTGYENTQNNY